jgi:hypothetical protein
MQTVDGWKVKIVFNRRTSLVMEFPPELSTRRVWKHVLAHFPRCAIYELRRPTRYSRKDADE